MEDTIFTRIVKGEISAHKVYEDEKTLAFMDIYPIQPGMVLVITKAQVDNIEDLPDEDYMALWAAVKKVSRALREAFPGKRKIAIQVEGLDVPHAHVKLFPFNHGEEFHAKQDTSKEPDHAALAALAEKLRPLAA